MGDWYVWVKAVHVIAAIAWMAGLLYLPRLFVYHSEVAPDSDSAKLFIRMERRLMHAITVPAATVTWVLGLVMVTQIGLYRMGWLHGLLFLAVLLTIYMFAAERWRRDLAAGRSTKSAKFFRIANEIPTFLMILIVLLAVAKPF